MRSLRQIYFTKNEFAYYLMETRRTKIERKLCTISDGLLDQIVFKLIEEL